MSFKIEFKDFKQIKDMAIDAHDMCSDELFKNCHLAPLVALVIEMDLKARHGDEILDDLLTLERLSNEHMGV